MGESSVSNQRYIEKNIGKHTKRKKTKYGLMKTAKQP